MGARKGSVRIRHLRNTAAIRGMVQDITERKQIEDQVRYLAFYDALTGLPNRRLLIDRMVQAMAQ